MRYIKLIYLLFPAFFLFSCKKNEDRVTTGQTNTDFGILYYVTGQTQTLNAFDLNNDTILWKRSDVFAEDLNGMVYDEGLVYTGSVKGIAATDARTGTLKWRVEIGGFGYSQGNYAPCNQPVIKDSLVFIITYKGTTDHAYLSCLQKKTGQIKWQNDLCTGMYSVNWRYSTPVVINDKIFALSQGLPDENRVSCFNIATGNRLWVNTSVPYILNMLPTIINSKPAFSSNANLLYSFDTANGTSSIVYGAGTGAINSRYAGFSSNNLMLLCLSSSNRSTLDDITYIDALDATTGQLQKRYQDTLNGLAVTNKKMYVQNARKIVQARSFGTYAIDWAWNSPSKAYLDTMSTRSRESVLYSSYIGTLLSNDSLVFYYENFFGRSYEFPQAELNSLFILDAITGNKLKEIKFGRPLPQNLLGRNLMVLLNGKVLRSPQH